MLLEKFIEKLFADKFETAKFIIEILIIYIIIRFRHKDKSDIIELSGKVVDKLIEEFEPAPLIENTPPEKLLQINYNKKYIDLANYDVFNMRNSFKTELQKIVEEYGIGTCGPPLFFGTLDMHNILENKISDIIGTEKSILYSNTFTCIFSVISCFAAREDVIFYYKYANEAIIRGVYLSKSKCHEFEDLQDLELLLNIYTYSNSKNIVIVEGLSKNTGQILNVRKILEFKKKYDINVILDETLSIPLLGRRGVCELQSINPCEFNMRIGSFGNGFTSNGAFFTGPEELVTYQKLASSSYVFSASLPAVLTRFNILALDYTINIKRLHKKIKKFHEHFRSANFLIISDLLSPIIVIKPTNKNINQDQKSLSAFYNVQRVIHSLHKKGIYCGLNQNPIPSIRVVINNGLKNIKMIAKLLSDACENY